MSVLASAIPKTPIVVFRIKDNPNNILQMFETQNAQDCIQRLSQTHPHLELFSIEYVPGRTEAREMTRNFNKMMHIYDKLLNGQQTNPNAEGLAGQAP